MLIDVKIHIRANLPRDLLLDLHDMAGAQALRAWEMIRDHAGLDDKRARELVGQARFRMLEKGFVEVCERHGAAALPDGMIPGTEIRAFQPFMRFAADGPGVVLGLASMPGVREIPNKNQSRSAGVILNEFITPRLDLGDLSIKAGDIFVLFLVARDRSRLGMIEEIAVGVIDASYKSYLFYEAVDGFLEGYLPAPSPEPVSPAPPALVRLKPRRTAFRPPESQNESENKDEGDGSPA